MDPRLIIKAIKIKIALNRLSKAKENAVRLHMGLPPLIPWYRKCYISCMGSLKRCLCRLFCPCCIYDGPKRIPRTCCGRIFTDSTYENGVLRNFMGFLFGMMTTMAVYFILVFQMEFRPVTSSIVGSVIGLLTTNATAFFSEVRCITWLTIPHLFGSTGRYFLLMYVMILVLTHPVKNFNHNIMVMSDSSTCGQQMAYNQTKELVDAAVAPIATAINGIRIVMKSLRNFSNLLRKSFLVLKKAVEEIAASVGRVLGWLKSIVTVCNHKMGAPYRKCTGAFDRAEHNCRDALGWFFSWICGIVSVFRNVCHIVRFAELLCLITSLIRNLIIDKVAGPLNNAIVGVYDMFYFNVSIHYSYKFNVTQSKTFSEVKRDIMAEISQRVGQHSSLVDIVQYIMMASFLFVLIKAMIYRRKYLTNDKYDNIYITLKVQQIEERRCEMGTECILPLKRKESRKYIKASSIAMAKHERSKLVKGIMMFLVNFTYAFFYMACDYSLYWLLSLLKKQLELKIHSVVPPHLKIHVQGEGALADMYRALVGFFDPVAAVKDIDTTPCLPKPSVPNIAIYKQIGIMFGIYLFLTLFESYGLRLRHVIAACYYPKREKKRAIWLYNHILKTRGSFLKRSRRTVKRKHGIRAAEEKISIRGMLAARYPIAGKLFKLLGWDRKSCIFCGKEGRKEDHDNFQHCVNAGCDGIYCTTCYLDLNNMCTVCMNPIDYGDFSDFSEERDSSEDEEEVARMKEMSMKRREDLKRLQQERAPENILKNFQDQLHIMPDDMTRKTPTDDTDEIDQ